jgi:bacteriorhodopsin
MASGMGVALQRQFENAADGSRVLRQVFYARYIDWCKSDVIAPDRSSLTRCV